MFKVVVFYIFFLFFLASQAHMPLETELQPQLIVLVGSTPKSANRPIFYTLLIKSWVISYLAIQQFIDGWDKFPYMAENEKPHNRNRYSCQSTFFFSKQIFVALEPSIYYVSTFLDNFDPHPTVLTDSKIVIFWQSILSQT